MYLTIITFIIAVLAIIGIFGFSYSLGKSNIMLKIGMISGVITFIFTIITVLYFMIESVNQMQEARSSYFLISGAEDTLPEIGFWWNTNINGANISAGPGYSWYLMIIAGIIVLISSIILYKNKKAEVYSTTPSPYPPNQ